jgi:multidrug resistance efflux pump
VAVNEATAGTFSLLPQGNTSGNFTKVTQLVPVKIAVDYGEAPLVLGSSAEVKIRVQD